MRVLTYRLEIDGRGVADCAECGIDTRDEFVEPISNRDSAGSGESITVVLELLSRFLRGLVQVKRRYANVEVVNP